jgi:hypothetical protein
MINLRILLETSTSCPQWDITTSFNGRLFESTGIFSIASTTVW